MHGWSHGAAPFFAQLDLTISGENRHLFFHAGQFKEEKGKDPVSTPFSTLMEEPRSRFDFGNPTSFLTQGEAKGTFLK